MRAHIIENGKVVNTIVVKNLTAARAVLPGVQLIKATGGGIGDLWDGTNFTPDPDVAIRAAKAKAEADFSSVNSQAAGVLDDLIAAMMTSAVMPSAKMPDSVKEWQTKRQAAKAAMEGT